MTLTSNSDIAALFDKSKISAAFKSEEERVRVRKLQGASIGGKINGAANTAWRGHFLGSIKTALDSGYKPRKNK